MSRRPPIIQDDFNSDPELEPLVPSDPSCPQKPAPFEFLTANVYYTETLTSRERRKAKRMMCECQFDPEQDDPADACGESCLNRVLMIECGSRCPCGEYCTNKRFQRGAYAPVEVFKTKKKGWGLRSLANISSGTFVMEYCGEVITPVQFEERKKEYTAEKRRHYYFMSLRSDEILDATRKGNYSRFINHSCSPNCETQKWTVQGKLRIGFFSVREILEREEITFDYQFQRFGDVAQRCYCGSANCRGYLGQSKQTTPYRAASTRSLRDMGSPREGGWRRRHTVRSESREDTMFEKQIYDIVGSNWRLRKTDQVISISRIMLQAESIGQRVMLLHVLQATEDQVCLRKFLSLHGLRLLWSWMVDSPEPESLTVLHFREQVLQTLSHLPITTRNQLTDSHLLTMVTRWLKPTTKQPEQVSSITGPPQSLEDGAEALQSHSQQQATLESSMEATVITEADSNMDREGIKMEEEEGSCDSVGVVTLRSCDSMATSSDVTHDYHPDTDSQSDAKSEESAVKISSGDHESRDTVVESRQPSDLKIKSHLDSEPEMGVEDLKEEVDSKEKMGVVANEEVCVVNTEEDVGVLESKEEVGVVNTEEDVGVLESKEEVGVVNSREEVGVVNTEEDVGVLESKEEVGVVNSQEEVGVVNTEEDVGVLESKEEVGVVNSQEEVGVVNAEEDVGVLESKEEVGMVNSQEEVGVVNAEEDVGVLEPKEEVGVVNSQEEVHVGVVNAEDVGVLEEVGVVNSKEEVGVVNTEEDTTMGVMESKEEMGVVESKQEVGVVKDTSSDVTHVMQQETEPQLGTKQEEGVVNEVRSERSHITMTTEPSDPKQDAHTVTEAPLHSEQEEGVVMHARSEASGDSRAYSEAVMTAGFQMMQEPCSHSEEKESVPKKDSHKQGVMLSDATECGNRKQVESEVRSCDNGERPGSSDCETTPLEEEVRSHDAEVTSENKEVIEEVVSRDEEMESYEMKTKSHDKTESCDVEITSHDRTLESSYDNSAQSHDVELPSPVEKMESHDLDDTSHEKSHDEKMEVEVTGHDKRIDVGTTTNDGSCDAETTMHDESHDIETTTESCDAKITPQNESRDVEMTAHDESRDVETTANDESRDVEMTKSHDVETKAHDAETTAHDEPRDAETTANDESRDVEMTALDESRDVETTAQDAEMTALDESCDVETTAQDVEMTAHDESHDAEITAHDESRDVATTAHDESRDVETTAHGLEMTAHDESRDMKDAAHGLEMTAHDESRDMKDAAHGVEMTAHDKSHDESHETANAEHEESPDMEMTAHDPITSHDNKLGVNAALTRVESESQKDNAASLQDITVMSPDSETQSHDDHMMHVAIEDGDSTLNPSSNAGDTILTHSEAHPQGVEGYGSRDDRGNTASNDVCVTSTDVQDPTVFTEKSHDSAVKSQDSAEESHDSANKSQDSAEKSHDSAQKSHDSAEESHDSADKSQDSAEKSHDSAQKSHDSAEESHDSVANSNDNVVSSNSDEQVTHTIEKSLEKELESHDTKEESCESNVKSPDHSTGTWESKIKSHDIKEESCEREVKSHDIKEESCEREVKLHDTKEELHQNEVVSHDAVGKSHDSEAMSHDREEKSCDVKSNSSDSLSGEENEVMSCEAEAKPVRNTADEEFVATNNRVFAMATQLLEKWEGLKKVFRIPKMAQSAKKVTQSRVDSPREVSDGGGREEESRDLTSGGRGRSPRSSGAGSKRSERKRRWDHWTWSPPPPEPLVTRQKDTPPTWSGKRKVLLPKPKNIFPTVTTPLPPSHPHIPSQGTFVTTTSTSTAGTTSTTIPSQSPYVITQNTGTGFTSATRFPTPPIPVQNTVIVQQGGQSVYVQQQVYRDGCQTTIMPTQYMTPTQSAFMIPPPSLQAPQVQLTSLNPPSFPQTVTSQPLTQSLTQLPPSLPTLPHLPIPCLPSLPSLPPQIPPTGFIRPPIAQHVAQIVVAPPTSQSSVSLSSVSLPPPPPTVSVLPHNWRTAKDPQGKTYYYHVITRKSQWSRPTAGDADGSVTMDLASSDEEDSSQTESLRAPHTPDGTPPPLTMATEKYYDTESTDATPSPYPSPRPHTHTYTSPQFPLHSPHRSPLPSPHTPPLHLPPPSTPPPTHQESPHFPRLPGPSTPPLSPLSPSNSPTTSPNSPSPRTHSPPSPRPPPEKRAKVTKSKEQKQKELLKHKISRVVTQCLDQHRKPDCKYGRITCSEDFKYLARKLTHGLAEKELQYRHGSIENLVFNDSVKVKVKEYIRTYMKKSGPVYTRL